MDHEIVSILKDKKAIAVAKVQGVNDQVEAIIVASGESARHVRALANYTIRFAKDAGDYCFSVEGLERCNWVVIDLGNLMVHLFRQEVRDYYQVDELWGA